MKIGFLFPGQGSQTVGMGADLFEARPDLLGEAANEILGFDLRRMCLDGPEDELTRTQHAQPALFAISYALFTELDARSGLVADAMAGHSLGEYTALTAAGAFDYETGLGLVALRGRAMAESAEVEPSGMAALIGADEDTARRVCAVRSAAGGRLQVANINAPGQVVVAGGRDDIDWLVEHGREHGIRRAIPLKVAGAFHSTFMEDAAAEVASALAKVGVQEAKVPVWANTTAQPHVDGDVAGLLARQVVEPVRFAESLTNMSSYGIDRFVHIGPGDVTAGLARKTVPDATTLVVSSIGDIPAATEALGTIGAP